MRTETGARVSGPPLQIPLSDVAPQSLIPSSLHGATIQIPLDKICDSIEKGERIHANRDSFVPEAATQESESSGGPDRDDDGYSSESEGQGVDKDYAPSRAGSKNLKSYRSPVRTRSRTGNN